jgi:hypothetical protein
MDLVGTAQAPLPTLRFCDELIADEAVAAMQHDLIAA